MCSESQDPKADTLLDPLSEPRFSYQATKSGSVMISYQGRVIKTLKGREADRFIQKMYGADARAAQLLMAKATGHFKH